MSETASLPCRLTFPKQEALDEMEMSRFDKLPLLIIERYLQHFNEEGKQTLQVPGHILESLAKRFLACMKRENPSLDKAFGGSLKRQIRKLEISDRDYAVLMRFFREMETVRKGLQVMEKTRREPPYELAAMRTANYFSVVHKIKKYIELETSRAKELGLTEEGIASMEIDPTKIELTETETELDHFDPYDNELTKALELTKSHKFEMLRNEYDVGPISPETVKHIYQLYGPHSDSK